MTNNEVLSGSEIEFINKNTEKSFQIYEHCIRNFEVNHQFMCYFDESMIMWFRFNAKPLKVAAVYFVLLFIA